jgi:hypothetical protein
MLNEGRNGPEPVVKLDESGRTELLRVASFEPSRHTPGTHPRRPGGAA